MVLSGSMNRDITLDQSRRDVRISINIFRKSSLSWKPIFYKSKKERKREKKTLGEGICILKDIFFSEKFVDGQERKE